ncbi:TetR family transcriptional regulator C-terminal domain-containing protein [Sulfitobacter aestuariivivens]|nr:TetR family transcriptional regulator C-terminal domain-containing protein [Sulfitobacter aestuariivivens]
MDAKTAPAKKRTAPREIRRKQLIMAAIDSISKRGFSETTLKHVTEKAKLSHGVVNYHFDSKEALYDATLGHLAKEHHEVWTQYLAEAGPTAAEQLDAIVRADFDKKICTRKRLAVWFAFWGQAKYRPNYLKIHNKFDNERFELIREKCAVLIEEGEYQDLDVEHAARVVEAMADGSWLCLMLYPGLADRETSRDDCLDVLSRYFPRHFPIAGSA